MDGLALLSRAVEDPVRFSEINEGVTVESQIAGKDEASVLGVEALVESDQIFPIVVIKYDHAVVVRDSESPQRYMCSTEASFPIPT